MVQIPLAQKNQRKPKKNQPGPPWKVWVIKVKNTRTNKNPWPLYNFNCKKTRRFLFFNVFFSAEMCYFYDVEFQWLRIGENRHRRGEQST